MTRFTLILASALCLSLTAVTGKHSAPRDVQTSLGLRPWPDATNVYNARQDSERQNNLKTAAEKVSSFEAAPYEEGRVLLSWKTGVDIGTLGYNLYREEGGVRALITPSLIAGSALVTGGSMDSRRSYSWIDSESHYKRSNYLLEQIDLNGASTWYGPANIASDNLGEERLNADGEHTSLLSPLRAHNKPIYTTLAQRAAKPIALTSAGLDAQSELASQPTLKMAISEEGWYRVTAQELFAAGLDTSIDPRILSLHADGIEQSFIVNGEEDGVLDPVDSIEFYGIGLDAVETATRVYWLASNGHRGKRVPLIRGKGSRPTPSSIPYTVEVRERTTYFSSLRNGTKENFFGAVITQRPVDHIIRADNIHRLSAGDASIEISLQGVTTLEHRVRVELNGEVLGELMFVGQAGQVSLFQVPQTSLRDGQNTVTLTASGSNSDVTLLDYIRLTYPRQLVAASNGFRLSLDKKRQATIGGFNTPAIRVWDITDPNDVRQVAAQVHPGDGGYSVTVSAPKPGGRTLWALAEQEFKRVTSMALNRPSNLRSPDNAADYLIIAHRDFIDSVRPLRELRESQGIKVTIVDVEDVFDEFNYGEKSAQPIKDFLSFARTNWRVAPRFALFVGDASLDPKNYLGQGNFDYVPTGLIDTLAMETVSDEWIADFDGDGLAELALGRLPVRNATQASGIVEKIVSYESAPKSRSILLVSDLNDGIDFHSAFVEVRRLVPSDTEVTHIDRGELGTAAARNRLIQSFNSGLGIISYFGHGTIDQWRGELLTSADAGTLSSGDTRPLVFAITCLNGYFQDPVLNSLAESLLYAERGAVAVWASSGLCSPGPQALMDQEMFRIIYGNDRNAVLTMGEAAKQAKSSITDVDVRLTYVLFGDPASRIR